MKENEKQYAIRVNQKLHSRIKIYSAKNSESMQKTLEYIIDTGLKLLNKK